VVERGSYACLYLTLSTSSSIAPKISASRASESSKPSRTHMELFEVEQILYGLACGIVEMGLVIKDFPAKIFVR